MNEVKKITLTHEEIKARLKVVCICKGIKQGRICDTIMKESCLTVESVNQKTGSGSGGCKGRRCKPVIEQLISQKGKPMIKVHENVDIESELENT
jgi:NAD(P)H-nitrite reductase large subunit